MQNAEETTNNAQLSSEIRVSTQIRRQSFKNVGRTCTGSLRTAAARDYLPNYQKRGVKQQNPSVSRQIYDIRRGIPQGISSGLCTGQAGGKGADTGT